MKARLRRYANKFGARSADEALKPSTQIASIIADLTSRSSLAGADPLLGLLQRYRAERKAFDEAAVPNQDFDRLAKSTWVRTQNEIVSLEPPATTADAALLALNHVLESDELFAGRSEWEDLQLLWLLVKAARDYIQSNCLS